jgi:hypothetical protein
MSPQDRVVSEMRLLVEQHYLESVSDQARDGYTRSSDAEKRTRLRAFVEDRAKGAMWAKIFQERL